MADIQKFEGGDMMQSNSMLPMLFQGGGGYTATPQVGLIGGFIQSMVVSQRAEIARSNAEIARYEREMFQGKCQQAFDLVTLSSKIKRAVDENEHAGRMCGLEEEHKKQIIYGVMLDNEGKKIKNSLQSAELEMTQMEIQIKASEFKRMNGGG